MTIKAFSVALAALLTLGACGDSTPASAPAGQEGETMTAPPVPVLKVGEPYVAGLIGDGQATITVLATEVSDRVVPGDPPTTQARVRLVVTVKIVLDKAGDPITGGAHNFEFLDHGKTLHEARTHKEIFPPELGPIDLITTGQQAQGKVFFDVSPDLVKGGDIQLMTGQIVHAIWRT